MQKQIIKQISKEVYEALDRHADSQAMDALFDGGEFSTYAADLSSIVQRWHLDTFSINQMISEAQDFEVQHSLKMKLRKPLKPCEETIHCNPWYFISQNLQELLLR